MSDDFTEQDLDTPTEADLDLAYGSKYLSVNDVGDRKIRTKILKVGKDKLRGNEGKERLRFVLHLENLDKAMVVNATNKDELTTALGRVPVKWIGATVGLYVDSNVMFAGKRVKGLRLRVLGPAKIPKPAPAARQPVQSANKAPWPDQEGDPGFDPDSGDATPDLTAA